MNFKILFTVFNYLIASNISLYNHIIILARLTILPSNKILFFQRQYKL